ncbi:MAG: adenylate/guanylate cyclase domain-containing protein, partial [Candidatus Limnocylindrales bacterium]
PTGAKFCPECGAPTVADSGSPPSAVDQAPPIAERRLVSVLFADLVGFTALSEGRDPEETRDLLSRYFDFARERVERYGGTIEKFIGDAVMAVWGTPQAFEDDPERAVRAALDLVADVGRLGGPDADLRARAAVLTGEAAVTIGAQGQGMVAGDLVNSASRLQSVADAGTVLVGEATQRASAGAIAYEALGEQALRGKTLPLAAWRALRVVGRRGGQGRSETLEAPFVGRADELALLKDLYHSTVRERRARIVSITGQAGIGKSRLAWEMLKYLDGISEVLYWHQGRSPAFGEGISFWALGEMVRSRAAILEDEMPEASLAKLQAMVAEFVPDPDERRAIEPALASLLGLDVWTAERAELFGAWRRLFEHIAARGSAAVMVFEDVQWADFGLIDFIEELVSRSRLHPILVITLARPEFLDRRPTWGAGQRNFTSLHLEPLGSEAMAELLEGLVPGLPGAIQRAILARAEGVPLYAVEIVRMLVADGHLVRDDDRYRVARPLDQLAVPESLHALIAARLDALDGADRALLQDAAVLGQSFTLAAIVSLTGQAEEALRTRLDGLVEREWLIIERDQRSPERGQYQFVQSLIREVAYATLAKRERRSRHLAAARYFESLDDPELPGLLATHYLAAYRSTPEGPDADALAVQSRIALRAAAERAASLGSQDQTVAYLREALAISDDPDERVSLQARAGEAAIDGGRFDEAVALLEPAYTEALSRGRLADAAFALARIGTAMIQNGQPEEALARMERSLDEVGSGDDEGHARLIGQVARGQLLVNRPAGEIIAACDRALAIAEPLDAVPLIADVLITKGTAISRDHAREGVALLIGALALAESRDDIRTQLRALNNLGIIEDDDPVASAGLTQRGVELARRIGSIDATALFSMGVANARLNTGDLRGAMAMLAAIEQEGVSPFVRGQIEATRAYLATLLGDADEAADAGRNLDELLKAVSHTEFVGYSTLNRAFVALIAGRLAEAVELGEAFAATDLDPFWANMLLARCSFRMGDRARARSAVAQVDAAPRHGRSIDAHRLAVRASLAALDGRTAEALERSDEAYRRLRELGLGFEVAVHRMDLAYALSGTAPGPAVAVEARNELEGVGAVPLVAQLDELLGRVAPEAAREDLGSPARSGI